MSRSTTWHSLCVQADPDFNRMSRWTTAYEFSSPGISMTGIEGKTHEFGMRIFLEDYAHTGPYAPEAVGANNLTWNGLPISWNGDAIDWTD